MAFSTQLVAALGGGGPIDARNLRAGTGIEQSFIANLPAGTWLIDALVKSDKTGTGTPIFSIGGVEVVQAASMENSSAAGYVNFSYVLQWGGGTCSFSSNTNAGSWRTVTAVKVA
jgi:hypothetical protein